MNPEQLHPADPTAENESSPESEPAAFEAPDADAGTRASEPDFAGTGAASGTPAAVRRPAPERPTTGEAGVDEATALLGTLVDLPVADHVAVFEDAHRQLHEALADLDEG